MNFKKKKMQKLTIMTILVNGFIRMKRIYTGMKPITLMLRNLGKEEKTMI